MKKNKDYLKIIMFGHKHIPSREGGVEIVVGELSSRMAAMGHDVTCYNRSGHFVGEATENEIKKGEYKGVKIRSVLTVDFKGLAAASSSFFAAVKCIFRRADVIHIHAEGPALMTLLLRLFGKRVVVTVHGLDWQREKWKSGFASKYIKLGEKAAAKFANEIIVLSKGEKEYFKNTYGREVVRIPNGVDRPLILEPNLITEKFGLCKDEYVLFLGRLVPEKGVHHLIEAFKNIKTDKKLVIAGGASDTDDYANEIKELAKDDERIMFTGFVEGDTMAELYSNAYIYTLPSSLEGMPLSLLEAMSYGNACLVSDIPECAEVVGDNGEIVHIENAEDLQKSLQKLLDNPETVNKYKLESADFICDKYSWDDVVKKTLELYN